MGILIKGMEMPKDKAIAVVIHSDGTAHSAEMFAGVCTKYLTDCEAVPVPPHGRLIDADAFSEKIREIVVRQKYDEFYTESLSVGEILRSVATELRGVGLSGFNNAPTIIPAEEGE